MTAVDRAALSFIPLKIPVELLPSTTYTVEFNAYSEKDSEIQMQFVSYLKFVPVADIVHHQGIRQCITRGTNSYKCELATHNFNTTDKTEHYLIIAAVDPQSTYITFSGIEIGQTTSTKLKVPLIERNNHLDINKIVMVSTWKIKCGIATYTEDLSKSINKICVKERSKNNVIIYPLNSGICNDSIDGRLVHFQHEYGIIPTVPRSGSKVIVTFHTVSDMGLTIPDYEKKLNIVGYVVHFIESKAIIEKYTKKDIWLIPHGSKIIPCANVNMERLKEYARDLLLFDELGITVDEPCAFAFGFQSGNKNLNRLVQACKNTRIKLIISGAVHQSGYKYSINSSDNIVFLNQYLNNMEIDLYALASDLLLFDYAPQNHYSCSGAMHRVVGAGRPVICSRTNHFVDIAENEHCLKFGDQTELESKILEALERKQELGKKAYNYAELTSWEIVARKHMEMYGKILEGTDVRI